MSVAAQLPLPFGARRPPSEKRCSACGMVKGMEDFYQNVQRSWNKQRLVFYRMGICKPCHNGRCLARYHARRGREAG